MEEEINYRVLRRIQQLEKNSPVLTDLKSEFYKSLSEYLDALNNRFEKEQDSQKKILLKDEIQNTKKIAVNIYEQREKKILLAAVSKARGGNPDLKNLESKEKDLFESVLNLMKQSRGQLLDKEMIRKELKKEETAVEPDAKNRKENDQINTNPIMRITEHIPEFIGTDEKKYNLRKGDIVTLPENMGKMLLKKGVAEEIKR